MPWERSSGGAQGSRRGNKPRIEHLFDSWRVTGPVPGLERTLPTLRATKTRDFSHGTRHGSFLRILPTECSTDALLSRCQNALDHSLSVERTLPTLRVTNNGHLLGIDLFQLFVGFPTVSLDGRKESAVGLIPSLIRGH